MSNDKQTTAVQWLQRQITLKCDAPLGPSFKELFEEALAIERQQIEDAYKQGTMDWDVTDEKDYFENTFTQ